MNYATRFMASVESLFYNTPFLLLWTNGICIIRSLVTTLSVLQLESASYLNGIQEGIELINL